jgi:hypothetical protein
MKVKKDKNHMNKFQYYLKNVHIDFLSTSSSNNKTTFRTRVYHGVAKITRQNFYGFYCIFYEYCYLKMYLW